eukprot:1187738-Prorocentrum_minimum.AAC.1
MSRGSLKVGRANPRVRQDAFYACPGSPGRLAGIRRAGHAVLVADDQRLRQPREVRGLFRPLPGPTFRKTFGRLPEGFLRLRPGGAEEPRQVTKPLLIRRSTTGEFGSSPGGCWRTVSMHSQGDAKRELAKRDV